MKDRYEPEPPAELIERLIRGNGEFISAKQNPARISASIRRETCENGQKPFAVILTCSDSRVPPEHIFSAGIGELFVIRTAGNVVGEYELGSIEYAVGHLNTRLVVVMGHSHCGAVAAATGDGANGLVTGIIDEIKLGIEGAANRAEAEKRNILHSAAKLLESPLIKEGVDARRIEIARSKYDIESGRVTFF